MDITRKVVKYSLKTVPVRVMLILTALKKKLFVGRSVLSPAQRIFYPTWSERIIFSVKSQKEVLNVFFLLLFNISVLEKL